MTAIEKLEGKMGIFGGYALIPSDKRPTITLSDGCDDTKTTQIKSVVWVCECVNNDNEDIVRVKCIDMDDEMWDVEEYMTEQDMETLFSSLKGAKDIDLPF